MAYAAAPVIGSVYAQEIGRVLLPAMGGGTTYMRVVVDLLDGEEQAYVTVLPPADQPRADDGYTPAQARELAALLLLDGAQLLEASTVVDERR